MNTFNATSTVLAIILATLATGISSAQNRQTNTMTNVLSVVDACDIIAIGVDFDIRSDTVYFDIQTTTANELSTQLISGDSNDSEMVFDTGDSRAGGSSLSMLSEPLKEALKGTSDSAENHLPGVYLACTTTPESLIISGRHDTATLNLNTTSASLPNNQFSSSLLPALPSTHAAAIDYSLTFNSVTSEPQITTKAEHPLFTGVFSAVGTIKTTAKRQMKKSDFYSDTAIATLTF